MFQTHEYSGAQAILTEYATIHLWRTTRAQCDLLKEGFRLASFYEALTRYLTQGPSFFANREYDASLRAQWEKEITDLAQAHNLDPLSVVVQSQGAAIRQWTVTVSLKNPPAVLTLGMHWTLKEK